MRFLSISAALLGLALVCSAAAAAPGQYAEGGQNVYVLTLEDAVRLALTNNLNIQSTYDVVQGSHISENLAEARFRLKVTPSYSRGVGDQSLVDQRVGALNS